MKLQQLHYVCAVAKHDLNVSEAAKVLHTSQPGISKQIRMLEGELGVPIFTRMGKRLAEVTPPGRQIIKVAERILQETSNLKRISAEFTNESRGALSIATTHTQACYALPRAIKMFRKKHPDVTLRIHQGNPVQIREMAVTGQADFAIATEAIATTGDLVSLPCYQWNRSVLVPRGHALLKKRRRLTFEDIARYPIITYDLAFAGGSLISKAFAEKKLTPDVVLTAIDSDVIKAYVELGLGIGLLASMAYDRRHDVNLRAIDVGHLFEPSTTSVGIRTGSFLRGYMYDFIELFAPHLTREVVTGAMSAAAVR